MVVAPEHQGEPIPGDDVIYLGAMGDFPASGTYPPAPGLPARVGASERGLAGIGPEVLYL